MAEYFRLLPDDFRSHTSHHINFRGAPMKKKKSVVRKNKKAKRRQQNASRRNRK